MIFVKCKECFYSELETDLSEPTYTCRLMKARKRYFRLRDMYGDCPCQK